MLIVDILAAAGEAAPQNKFGFAEALEQGGFIAYATVVILGTMSFGSFYILFTKWFEQSKIMRQYRDMRASFWKAPTLKEGTAKLEKNSAWRQIAEDGLQAEEEAGKLKDPTESHDWLHGSLARSEATINARLAGGLPFLATVGATAPFVGLFGTVVGIYRALIAIGVAGSASIDKVAGPVGEALIMTALGLLVAVPAVLAYNYLQSRNKRIGEMLTGFSTDVLANIASGGAVKPAAAPAKPTAPAKPAAAPAKS
ncbi:MotA/TolQ/ExbB proton channel family protein [Novosphingobium mangrovi (ex Huang et al. 2023)]|uniref:Biopolymer transport protein ExbB n=1 Tax=Novosphingobium mangrovi (ex Huang et al. 2023) TaxID=2976432 RepID=A0ABT2I2Y6_9SPHN|nr:MotA/TolQ/ExbB proton channel family protein [Novosphingobium mangrovi (ex Huang et al. 2023)]MCT2399164.1 MotA/TolQ/ExbB proton channel family protein [Novosphingobium mangrovi (ex Huang et al. 2023)]